LNSYLSKQTSAPTEDAIEVQAFKDWHEACPEDIRRAIGFQYLSINQGCAVSLPSANGAIFNRIFGLSSVDDLEEAYRWMSGKAGNKFLQLDLESASDDVRCWFLAKGFVEKEQPWAKLVCKTTSGCTPPPSAIACRKVDFTEARLFGSMICNGFGLPESLVPVWASIVGRAGWSSFFALDGDRPIGTGTMFSAGERSWLGAGTVLPAFGSRGAHKALINARLAEGKTRGTSTFAVEAAFSVSSAPNISYENLKKLGFEHVYSRKNCAFPDNHN
jgi:hypothetical protein